MAMTKDQMMAMPLNRFGLESQAADGIVGPSPPGFGTSPVLAGGPPPVLPGAPSADMPAPAPDANGVVPYPGVSSELHDYLSTHFKNQAAQGQALGEQARAFLGPNGPIGQLYADSAERTRAAGDVTQGAEQKRAAGEAELARQDADRQAKDQRETEARQRVRDKMVGDYQRRANVLADQAQNAEVRSFWADKSTGSRILGILAQTLSGAANGLAGNPGAPSPLDRIIDRDLEVQQKNMQNKRLAADQAQNALAHVYKGFESQDASIAAYRQAAANWVKAKSGELAAQFQGDTAPARNQMVQANQDQVIATAQSKIAEDAAKAAEMEHARADSGLNELARNESNEAEIGLAHQSDLIKTPGISVPVRKAVLGPAWQKQIATFSSVFAQYDNAERIVNKPGFSLTDKAEMDASNSLLEGANRGILGTGANLSAEEAVSLHKLSVDYLKSQGVDSASQLGLPAYKAYIHAMRHAVAVTVQAHIRTLGTGADLARDPGFESAFDSLHENDAPADSAAQ